ncbi:MAG: DUF1016 N-terminal domain-containing protein, partial [Victivallaceae bacterium]
IAGARQRAVLAANDEQIRLYHYIGRDILTRQSRQGWGAKVIDRLSMDLRSAFPDMKGLSSRNLKYMGYFARICPDLLIGQQSAAQLPWFHIVTLLTKVSEPTAREWYAREVIRCSVKPRNDWWQNTRSPAWRNPWVWRNTSWFAPCPNRSTPVCPLSRN